jgi:tetratricopeptide (TPR) repeat protein
MEVLLMLSTVALWHERDYAQADLLAAEWRSIAERAGDESSVLRALNTMALTALKRRDFDEARNRFVGIRETAEKIGDRDKFAIATVNLSLVGLDSGDFQAALDDATEAVRLFRELGDDAGVAVALGNCGWSALRLSDPVRAEEFFREEFVVAGRLGATGFIADHAHGLAAALVARHEYERAAELLGAAASLREELERGFDDEEHEELHERVVADAKAALGDEAFAAAWARGETTTPEEIVEFCAS